MVDRTGWGLEMETYEVDWHALTASPEEARSIPFHLNNLRYASDESAAIEAAYALHELLCYASVAVEEATVPAVRILYAMLAADDFRWKQYVLQLIDSIACADGVMKAEVANTAALSLKARIRNEVLRGIPLVVIAERSEVRDVRGAAIVLLADAAPDVRNMFDRFVAQLNEEEDPVLQADLAYAATTVYCRDVESVGADRGAAWLDSVLANPNPAIRYRVAQCLIASKFEYKKGVSLIQVMQSAEPEVLARRLFRREYM